AFKLEVSALEPLQHLILVVIRKLRKGFAGELALAGPVERGEPVAIDLHVPAFRLRTLLLHALHEGWADVEAFLPAVWARQLPVEEDRAARILAAGRIRIRRDDAIGNRLHRAAFVAAEEKPRARLHRLR